MRMVSAWVALVCGILDASGTLVRAQAQRADLPRFEVESIRKHKGEGPAFLSAGGDRLRATNFPLRLLIRNAYRLQPFQLVGGPEWLDEPYDIVAKSPELLTPERQRLMIQSLLADRFKLAAHLDTRDLPIYSLVLARADGRLGPRIARSQIDCAAVREGRAPLPAVTTSAQRPTCDWSGNLGNMIAGGIAIPTLADALSLSVGRPVVDRTGLTGYYEFDLSFSPGLSPPEPSSGATPPFDPAPPTIFTALPDQLGMKLESTRGAVQVLVVDSIQRPIQD